MTETTELAEFLKNTGPVFSSSNNILRKIYDRCRSKSPTKRTPLPVVRCENFPYVIDYKIRGEALNDTNTASHGLNPTASKPTSSNLTMTSHDKLVNLVHRVNILKNNLLKEHSRRLAAEQRAIRAEEVARVALNRLSEYE